MSSDDSQQPGGSQAAEEDEESAEESESEEDEQEEAPKQLQQPAKRPLSSRVRVVQGRRKPPLAPKPKEAAPPAKRSFLTLAVSAREYPCSNLMLLHFCLCFAECILGSCVNPEGCCPCSC